MCPGVKFPECVLAIDRSGNGLMTVGSLPVLLPGLASPPPATTATLVMLGGALPAKFTVSVIRVSVAQAAGLPDCVQVSVARVHVQPEPASPVAVKPDGSVSRSEARRVGKECRSLLTASV